MPTCPYCGKEVLEEVHPFYRENKKTSALARCDACGRFSEVWFDKVGKIKSVK